MRGREAGSEEACSEAPTPQVKGTAVGLMQPLMHELSTQTHSDLNYFTLIKVEQKIIFFNLKISNILCYISNFQFAVFHKIAKRLLLIISWLKFHFPASFHMALNLPIFQQSTSEQFIQCSGLHGSPG